MLTPFEELKETYDRVISEVPFHQCMLVNEIILEAKRKLKSFLTE